MQLTNPNAEIFVPDGELVEKAIARTTHMAIGCHQDDIEIMAYDGILKCFGSPTNWFTGVVVTNGAGSPRDDLYANYTDEDMQKVRRTEQKKAAVVGEYAAVALLDYSSSAVKDPSNKNVVEDIKKLLLAGRPQILYTHNLADKHDTHVSVALRTIQALRELPDDAKPKAVYGCEVWRDLDWMTDEDKVAFDLAGHENLAAALLGVFDSQICGGKRYDLATIGRRRANATYFESHGTDITTQMSFAMDLTPLIKNPSLDVKEYVAGYISRFANEVSNRLTKFS
ncbi:MAG: PIG-L family deacetylase [Armatimonadetes bacterium]|nr:PIG-L family deacetylase [Armatimonadota bacterium]